MKKLINRSILFQLSVYILVTVMLVISIVAYLTYDFTRKILIDKIEQNAIFQSQNLTSQISRNIVTVQEITRNISSQVLYYDGHGDLETFLSQVLKSNPVLSGFHLELNFPQGTKYISIISSGPDNVSIYHDDRFCRVSISPLIREKMMQGESVWSDPFYCVFDPAKLVANYCMPVCSENDNVIGAIVGQISLDFLDHVAAAMMDESQLYTFIIGNDGDFLTHPKKEWIMTRNIYDVSSKVFSQNRDRYIRLFQSHQAGSGFANPEYYNSEKSWFHLSPIPYTNWFVIIFIPAKEMFADLNLILKKVIWVSVVGMVLILIVIISIFRKMLSPLSNAVKSIRDFSFGNRKGINRKNEIELLKDSLQELQTQYNKYLQEQNKHHKDWRRIEKDLNSAKDIQLAIIPNEWGGHPEVDLSAVLQPAGSIGGDLFDYFFIDSSHLLFTMGDVSGKGIPAALFMAVAHTLIKSKATVLSSKKIIEQVNKELSKQNTNQNFLTVFLGILNTKTGVLNYCNAAHNYPLLMQKDNEVRLLEKTHGLPVGVYSNKKYSEDILVMREGDMLVLYTDGVTDCKDSDERFYGVERLSDNLGNMTDLSAHEVADRLLSSLTVFRGNTRQVDDISLMTIRYLGAKQEQV